MQCLIRRTIYYQQTYEEKNIEGREDMYLEINPDLPVAIIRGVHLLQSR